MFGDAQNGKQQPPMPKPSPIEIVFECTLAEFYNGANKLATFKREKLRHDAKSTELVEEQLKMQVRPGFSEDDRDRGQGAGQRVARPQTRLPLHQVQTATRRQLQAHQAERPGLHPQDQPGGLPPRKPGGILAPGRQNHLGGNRQPNFPSERQACPRRRYAHSPR